jgi:hypothetical protein
LPSGGAGGEGGEGGGGSGGGLGWGGLGGGWHRMPVAGITQMDCRLVLQLMALHPHFLSMLPSFVM